MPTISVPGHGDVEFPDSMNEADITAALKTLAPPPAQHGRLAEAAHKTASFLPMAGGIAGGALGAGAGAGIASILTGAVGAAALGGLGKAAQHGIDSALGYEQAPGVMDATRDMARTAGSEALGAGLGGAAGELIGAASRPLAGPLRKMAVSTTRRILRNTGGSLSAAKPLSADAAQEVLDMGLVKPFGTSSGTAERVDAAREAVGDQYGKIVQALEANGITGPDAQALAQQYAAEAAAVEAHSMNPSVTAVYKTAADQLTGKPTVNGRLGLSQTEDLKRSLQSQATSAYKQMQPGELARAHEDAASTMRQAVEDQIAQQTSPLVVSPDVKALAAQFEPVKQQAGRLIEAGNVANAGMARAANRNAISPADIAALVGEQAHSGNPLRAAAAALAMHTLRTRGPSTAAWAANAAADRLQDPGSRLLMRLFGGAGAGAGNQFDLASVLDDIRRKAAAQ